VSSPAPSRAERAHCAGGATSNSAEPARRHLHPRRPALARGRLVLVGDREKRQSTVRFDSDLFDEVAAFARKQQTTFNEAVSTLCEWGLEAEGK
jgi:hypothetical protein